ncbi:hypothetical protein NEUTE1DRAFT_130532 [Neurospora tetrasperma FGSC 2508]|uniref:DUF1168-domain-containing protein n=1 Tax=Neurospora tetrasperma (strain FGSC 2508 / ATCC MYA-4615 / P0657) TaxID=510951 RepID=F8MQL2_NEUT8|nr:uncharacterized protein NEUTE1DRAFT_130532 [Neurospora tetrasperma FGSC 2508]EGO56642.1 hypothetical protein NEUTE1DRAFT_130532 [Neurospora tetrasperma FGSC 2508]EGZ70484.1 DUF1168-domain-containing protein [Neurospora tetrasperma FGSC 2509]
MNAHLSAFGKTCQSPSRPISGSIGCAGFSVFLTLQPIRIVNTQPEVRFFPNWIRMSPQLCVFDRAGANSSEPDSFLAASSRVTAPRAQTTNISPVALSNGSSSPISCSSVQRRIQTPSLRSTRPLSRLHSPAQIQPPTSHLHLANFREPTVITKSPLNRTTKENNKLKGVRAPRSSERHEPEQPAASQPRKHPTATIITTAAATATAHHCRQKTQNKVAKMSADDPSSIPTSTSRLSSRPTKRLRASSPTSLQASHLQQLFAKPDREIIIPPLPSSATSGSSRLPPPPEIVTNVQGSSAGAGSGEFHVYKAARRREYERLRIMDEEVAKEKEREEFEAKKRERERADEEKTRRNREKREKKKNKGKGGKGGGGGGSGSGNGSASQGGSVTTANGAEKKETAKTGDEGGAKESAAGAGVTSNDTAGESTAKEADKSTSTTAASAPGAVVPGNAESGLLIVEDD